MGFGAGNGDLGVSIYSSELKPGELMKSHKKVQRERKKESMTKS